MKKLSYLMVIGLLVTLFIVPLKSHAETVTIVSNSNSGIENAQYTATLSDGTVLGFQSLGNNTYFCGAISQNSSLTVPDSVILYSSSSTNRYPVKRIGYNRLDFDNAPSVTSLTLPSLVTSLNLMAPTVKILHVNSYISDVNTNCLSELTKILVPSSTLSSYYGNQYWFNYVLINVEGKNPLKVTINMTKPGEFAQLLLQKTDEWKKVNELTVTGELNTDDLNTFKRMKQLTKLDLSGATIIDIPSNFAENNYGFGILETLKLPELNSIGDYSFRYCRKLKSVTLPKVNSIGQDAFQFCTKLQSITLPAGITSIGSYAFRDCGLKSIKIPNTITKISDGLFYNCTALASVTIPSSITEILNYAFYNTALTSLNLQGINTIGSGAFQDCKKLSKVTFYEGLLKFGAEAFRGCTALTAIDLPSSLREVGDAAFRYCSGIKKVTCRAATAPTHGSGNALLYGCDMTNVKLYVPAMSIDSYRAQNGWKSFYTILPLEDKLTDVLIYDDQTINDGTIFESGCNFRLDHFNQYRNGSTQWYCGRVDYNGTTTLSLGNYHQIHNLGTASSSSPYNYGARPSALIANGTIRANIVKTTLWTQSSDYWYFISLPYDVNVSEITYTDDVQFVIRRYSGLNRAQSSSNTWQNLTTDSIMHAYEGYILKCNKRDVCFNFPAVNNSNKNKIFEKGNAIVPLTEYLSEFEHNRSWNLVGNPYPCFYDTRFMEFTAPIIVWNRYNSRYDAYSPIDDSFILFPAQAFFVQCPVGKNQIKFKKDGRQKNTSVRNIAKLNGISTSTSSRELYNVYLSGGKDEDRTRFVVNEDAARSYELDKDASKLIADDNTSLLVYTVENGVRYAINERDLDDGEVQLGFYAPVEDEYNLTLESSTAKSIILVDNETGIETSMLGAYSFHSKAGYNDSRFTLKFDLTGIMEINNDNVKIAVNDGMVSANVPCDIYTIDGRFVGSCNADNAIYLAKGIYVISGNNVTRKIIVK